MKRIRLLYISLLLMSVPAMAQTESDSSPLPERVLDAPSIDINKSYQADSMRFRADFMRPQLVTPKEPQVVSYTDQIKQGVAGMPSPGR